MPDAGISFYDGKYFILGHLISFGLFCLLFLTVSHHGVVDTQDKIVDLRSTRTEFHSNILQYHTKTDGKGSGEYA